MKIPVNFIHDGTEYSGWLSVLDEKFPPLVFHTILNGVWFGTLMFTDGRWMMEDNREQALAPVLGLFVEVWYQ